MAGSPTLIEDTPELARFRDWILDSGRSEITGDTYVRMVRIALDAGGEGKITRRLTDPRLGLDAPKSLHLQKAALIAWARFQDDPALEKRIKGIRLPPSERVKPKHPLARDQWKDLIGQIRASKFSGPVKATLLLMALRGFRSGDVLRLRRQEISHAVKRGILSTLGKGRKRREIAAAPIMEPLELLDRETGPWNEVVDLLTKSKSRSRRKIAAKRVAIALGCCARKIRLEDVHPHRLRRTYATHFLKVFKGDPQALVKLQAHMGWANMQTALKYVDEVNLAELDQVGADLVKDLL